VRVLIVEDEVKLAGIIRRGMRERGMSADVATTGEDALWMAGATEYGAIVLDVMLPGIDGVETCRRLRADGVWAPVLMLTARSAVPDRIAGLDGGADDYLVKPFDFGELLARLRALIRRGPSERPPVLEVGDLHIDPAARIVRRAGREVELTVREFALLQFLAQRAGEVVSRAQLLDHVWDNTEEGSTNVVDVYIGYLRKKLELPFGTTVIRTIRGVGWTLEPAP
jgi:two-component system OmpR family response regulator